MTQKGRNWLLIAVVFMFLIGIRAATSHPMPPHPYFAGNGPLVIAHQGGDGLRPGNTMLAFRHAHALGVDVLELDVHLSRDDELVVMHDATVERTTDGRGAVRDMRWADLAALDAAYHWPYHGDARPYRGSGVTVPRLTDVLGAFPHTRLSVEMKQNDERLADVLCAALVAHDAVDRVLVASFEPDAMRAFRRYCPDVATTGFPLEVGWFMTFQKLALARLFKPESEAMHMPLTWGPVRPDHQRRGRGRGWPRHAHSLLDSKRSRRHAAARCRWCGRADHRPTRPAAKTARPGAG